MFTGIVTDIGEVVAVEGAQGTLRRLRIHASYDPETIALGASIACGGPCLTVVAVGAREGGCWFEVDAASETLERTTVPHWEAGTRINLERSLKIGDELGGHMVTGHVDGVASIVAREAITAGDDPWGPTARFYVKAPAALAPFIAEKGSVCLDGTSLTVNSVNDDVFSVLIIPHTLAVTTWGDRQVGDPVNLEVDLMARYVARLAEARRAG
ncbi:riboflavin synthase [Microvirga thermotolerans]|uniref:Riboflavin synthase n=1 Tax=Microvirga thermotolerans TaxID=2651334 RepID=A0A5P9JZA6_9HYPH|nr:riboflavin synthase [Microvirga thermotolerans]QFU16595.1 riboflavin synthase [Microvirga thermotolerans]